MKSIKFLLLILPLTIACNPEKVDTKVVQKELKEQKIKKVSEGEILSFADNIGGQIIDSVQKSVSFKLDSALNRNFESALPVCMLSNNPVVSHFEKEYDVKITRTNFSNKLRNQKNIPDALQTQLLEAYRYNLESKTSLFNNVQASGESILFNSPIILTEQKCLRCHGVVGKDLTKDEYQKILTKYPLDKSINLKMNDFMGIWDLKFSKSKIIKKM
jgi:hypothetical protein